LGSKERLQKERCSVLCEYVNAIQKDSAVVLSYRARGTVCAHAVVLLPGLRATFTCRVCRLSPIGCLEGYHLRVALYLSSAEVSMLHI